MKKGTFIILEENGRFIAAIRRADNGIIRLEDLLITDAIRALHGKECQYLPKAQNVIIDGKNIYKAPPKVETPKQVESPKKVEQRSWRSQLRDTEPDVVIENDFENVLKERRKLPDLFDLQKAQVPNDVKALRIDKKQVDNFSLKLNRFARFENVKGDEKFYFFNPKKREERDRQTNEKRTLLNEFEIHENYGHTNFQQITARAAVHAAALLGNDNLIHRTFTPNWRLIVGLGGESVYETSITLHHIYGFPYIPASSIKGVLRSFIIAEVFENHEGKAIADENFCDVFGCPAEVSVEIDGKKKPFTSHDKEARRGQVTFFDAFPTKAPTIKPDIMNPHYGDWYGNKKDNRGNPIAPTDTQSPVPVFFLTVEGTFQFLFGSKQMKINDPLWKDKTLADWLKDALAEHGIGAKTAVGYGAGELQ